MTVTVIAALASFDIVYISTQGGPGNATMVPGLEIYYQAFVEREVGIASALAVVLMVLVLACVLPDPVADAEGLGRMIVARREALTGQALLVLLIAITILPFLSLFTTALHPSGTYPSGLDWPADPQWGNFLDAFEAARMGEILKSSVLIVLGVVPVSLLIATMAGFAIGHLQMPGSRLVFLVFLLGLTLPFEGIITPLYYQVRDLGILNTRWAIILPLIGLFMPFSVFWMRAHFVNMPRDLSEAARIDGATTWQLFWRIHVPLARAGALVAGDPAVPVDVEPVPAGDRPRRRPDEAHDGRRAGRVPGAVGHRHPAAVRGIAADPDADADRLPRLPAPVRVGPAAGLAQGMSVGGHVAPGFEAVRETFAETLGDHGAAFAVTIAGEPVVDLWGGVADDRSGRPWQAGTLQVIFSGTKGLVALCLLMLADRGQLDLEAPVAHYLARVRHQRQARHPRARRRLASGGAPRAPDARGGRRDPGRPPDGGAARGPARRARSTRGRHVSPADLRLAVR